MVNHIKRHIIAEAGKDEFEIIDAINTATGTIVTTTRSSMYQVSGHLQHIDAPTTVSQVFIPGEYWCDRDKKFKEIVINAD